MDQLTFGMLISQLTGADYFRMANEPIDPSEFALASILPESLRRTYTVKRGSMRVIATMAEETGNDSPYAPTGDLEFDAWSAALLKFTGTNTLPEELNIQYQEMRDTFILGGNAQAANNYTRNFLLSWLENSIREGQRQRREFMRGEVLSSGKLTYEDGVLDMGVPEENIREFAGASLEEAVATNVWAAARWGNSQVKGGIRARLMSWNTLDWILDSTASSVAVEDETISPQGLIKRVKLRKLVGTSGQYSKDARDSVTLTAYKGEGRIKLPPSPGKPKGSFMTVPYLPDGVISFIGNNQVSRTADDGTLQHLEGLGETIIGPTVEAQGVPGAYMRAYTPENRPYHVNVEGAQRVMTVLEEPRKLAIARFRKS